MLTESTKDCILCSWEYQGEMDFFPLKFISEIMSLKYLEFYLNIKKL